MNNNIKGNVKRVMIVFLFCFVALISYIAYFQVFKAPKIAEMTGNRRAWAKRNEILRGSIYDKNGDIIAKSVRDKNGNQTRKYEFGDLYAHPIGYVDSRFGLTGLEKAYDKELTTTSNMSASFKKLLDDPSVDNLKEAFLNRGKDNEKFGNSVVTTLDNNLQKIAYNALGDNRGAVVALNPKNGDVLAMVSKPSFNPNNLEAEINKANSGKYENSPLINRATIGMYPPGSTFKVVTATSALENIPGIQYKTFNDNGKITFPDGRTMENAGKASYGNLNLEKAFVVSSNVVFGTLGMDLGNEKLMKTAEGFGFNKDIPANGFAIAKSEFPKVSNPGDLAQTGIGQSKIRTTPIQMALVASAVANNGVIMEPNLVEKVVDKDGKTIETTKPKKFATPMTESQAATIKGYMEDLVKKNVSTGKWSYLRGTDAAAKTGTADHQLPDGSLGTPHSWFIAFAPADNPKIALAVIVEDGGFGAGKAATIGGKLINAELNK